MIMRNEEPSEKTQKSNGCSGISYKDLACLSLLVGVPLLFFVVSSFTASILDQYLTFLIFSFLAYIMMLFIGIRLRWLGLEKLFFISLIFLAVILTSLRYVEKLDTSTFKFFMGTIVGVSATLAKDIVTSALECLKQKKRES